MAASHEKSESCRSAAGIIMNVRSGHLKNRKSRAVSMGNKKFEPLQQVDHIMCLSVVIQCTFELVGWLLCVSRAQRFANLAFIHKQQAKLHTRPTIFTILYTNALRVKCHLMTSGRSV